MRPQVAIVATHVAPAKGYGGVIESTGNLRGVRTSLPRCLAFEDLRCQLRDERGIACPGKRVNGVSRLGSESGPQRLVLHQTTYGALKTVLTVGVEEDRIVVHAQDLANVWHVRRDDRLRHGHVLEQLQW
jgi:hypothetical protein